MKLEDVKVGMRVRFLDDNPSTVYNFGIVREIESEDKIWCDWGERGELWEHAYNLICEDEVKECTVFKEDSGSAATSKHYNSKLIQPIEIAQMVLTSEEFQGAMKFNIMKYTQRAGSKEGESSDKDWNKALQYKLWLKLAEAGVVIDPRKDVV